MPALWVNDELFRASLTNATLKATTADAYFFLRDRKTLYEAPVHSLGKMAIVTDPNKDVELWRFYEICAQNAGLHMRLFHDKDEAIKWLKVDMIDSQT